ncbi:MAG: glutamine synthetase beta-grasp domain-containing protein, partial [Anaerolineales bacterium]
MTTKDAAKTFTTGKDVIEFAQKQGLKIVDFKFVDLPGTWQHFSATIGELSPEVFSEGIGFDGSSIRGFQAIHESDMLLMPDPATAIADPVCKVPTLSLTCTVLDPLTREPYSRDPRRIALKAEAYLTGTGIADVSYWGPEAEFFEFDGVSFEQNQHSAFYS